MKKDDLNGKFHNLYDEQMEFKVRKEVWNHIENELFPKKKRNGIVFWLSIFAGAIILTGTWFLNSDAKTDHAVAKNNSQKHSKHTNTKQSKSEDNTFSKNNKSDIKTKITNNEIKNTSQIAPHPRKVNQSNVKTFEFDESKLILEIAAENISKNQDSSQKNIDCTKSLKFLPTTSIYCDLKKLSLILPQETTKARDTKLTMTAGIAFGKNVRFTNNSIDPELSVTKHRGDNRMALNLIQFRSNFIYNLNENYALGIGANYGNASRRSPWYNRPTYFSLGQKGLDFQTLEGRYTIIDTALLNSLAVNDTTYLRLKNNLSIKIISLPISIYRQIQKNNWITSINTGLSADIHFGKQFSFEVEQNNISRQLIGLLDVQRPTVSLQGLIGARFTRQNSNSFVFYVEPQLSIPLSSYLSQNNQRSYAMSLTFTTGLSYKL